METQRVKNLYIFSSKNIFKVLREQIDSELKELTKNYEISFIKDALDETKMNLVEGADAIICFVRDKLDDKVLGELKKKGIKAIFLRCQNHYWVDEDAARKYNIPISYAPYYSPYSVAEYTMALLTSVNRKIHKAYNRVREGNFELDGLLGVDLHGKTVGILGFGKIGQAFAKICIGYGMRVIVWDKVEKNEENLKIEFKPLDDVLAESDVISLHLQLNDKTRYIINDKNIKKMKHNVFLLNTARGALVDSEDLLKALKTGKFSGVGLDVYDDKKEVFYKDYSEEAVIDDVLTQLISIPRVVVTCRQGWLTKENVITVYKTVFRNVEEFNKSGKVIDSIY